VIRRYNRSQTIKAIFLIVGGLFCCGLAFLFFRYLPAFLASQFRYTLSTPLAVGIGFLGLAAAWFSGYRTWKARGGLFSYHESGLYHDLDGDTAGAHVVDFYAHRVTGPAYVLGQIFMAGPQFLLKAWTLLRSRITHSPDLESRLEGTLAVLRTANKWQGLNEYPGSRSEILYLAQIGLLDFSAHKGTPRFKAR
jgi:hypothetical protein